jgi:hypothetical protein
MDKKKEEELLFAQCFAKTYFPDHTWKLENLEQPLDILASTSAGIMAWELTRIATNQEGFRFQSYKDNITRRLQLKLRQLGITDRHFCLCFKPSAQLRFNYETDAVDILLDFIQRNNPEKLDFQEIWKPTIPHSESAYELLEFIESLPLEAGSETTLCQVGTTWAGGLRKELVQKIIENKNDKLTAKRKLQPDIPHWLIMVIEYNEGSSAAFWEKLAHETFNFDYDACFIFEMVTNSYIKLKKIEEV